jgi:hypothetical protein
MKLTTSGNPTQEEEEERIGDDNASLPSEEDRRPTLQTCDLRIRIMRQRLPFFSLHIITRFLLWEVEKHYLQLFH